MAATETIQFRVPHGIKADLAARCESEGKTVSEGAREALEEYLYGEKSPADEFEDIFSDADEKLAAARLPEPSIEEITEFCKRVRAERASEMLA